MTTPIKLYTLSTCGHCKDTKQFLDECNAEYDFTDLDLLDQSERQDILEELKQLNPRCSVPTIVIGEKVIVGFKEDEIKEAIGL